MRTICPVCSEPAPLYARGRVGPHRDGIGKECWMVGRTQPPWEERGTRVAVSNRSGGICEWCRKRRAAEMHHRHARGTGGPWTPGNIVHLCSHCHRMCTENPNWARSLGLRIDNKSSEHDPEKVPVTREDGTQFQPTSEVTNDGNRR